MSYRIQPVEPLFTFQVRVPYYQAIIAWFFSTYANKWKWHRQKQGGRWARIFKRENSSDRFQLKGWEQVPKCTYLLYPDSPIVCVIGECTKEQCNCEVYGSSSGV
jgi:hypothetical protein